MVLFGVGAPPILVYFSGDWAVHWGYGLLTHGHMDLCCQLCNITIEDLLSQ